MRGRTPAPEYTMRDVETAQLRAAVQTTLSMVRERSEQHAGNRDLVDLCLDVHNELFAATIPVIPGR